MKRIILLGLFLTALVANAQYQLPNPGFEQWDGNSTSEPTHWNSFASSDGTYSSLASSPHHYRRNGGRPGSTGSHFLTIYTKSILGVKANGNMTTGRIHAGSTSASSNENYNYTQRSNSDFRQPFSGTPDSLYIWVSFYATSASSQAQVSAILHGNNDFKSPNDENSPALLCGKAVAKFTRTTSSSSSYSWQKLRVPFVYSGNATGAYMLVNLTTNATPGEGSANDSLSIDDIEFIYSAWLTSISVAGLPLEGFEKGVPNYVVHVDDTALLATGEIAYQTEVEDASVAVDRQRIDDTTARVTLTVTAEDGVTIRHYTVTLTTGDPSGSLSVADNTGLQPPAATLNVYPNPTHDKVRVDANGLVTLSDLAGRILDSRQVHGTATFDLSTLAAGTYLLRCAGITRPVIKR